MFYNIGARKRYFLIFYTPKCNTNAKSIGCPSDGYIWLNIPATSSKAGASLSLVTLIRSLKGGKKLRLPVLYNTFNPLHAGIF